MIGIENVARSMPRVLALRGQLIRAMLLGGAAVLACASASARAQAEPTLQDEAVAGEIVVTASLRETNLQRTPLSITALTADALQAMGAVQFSDFYRTVPGLFVMDRGPNDKKFVIRGIQNDVISGGGTVGVYVDDMPISLSGAQLDLNLFDLERVEVLRGPQGTLYGASSMAGTIKYITRKPDLDRIDAAVQVGAAVTESGGLSRSVEGMLNVPLIEGAAAARIVGYHRNNAGYIDKVYPGEVVPAFAGVPADAFFPGSPPVRGHETFQVPAILEKNANDHQVDGVRASVRLAPVDDLTVTGSVLHEHSKVDEKFAHQPDLVGNLRNGTSIHMPAENKNTVLNLTAEYDFGPAQLYASSNYFRTRSSSNEQFVDIFPAELTPPGTELITSRSGRAYVQELRLHSAGDTRFNWLIGAWHYKAKGSIAQIIQPQFDPGLRVVDEVTKAQDRQWALFGELSYELLSGLTATAGVRYWSVKQSDGPKVINIDPVIFFLSPRGVDNTINTFKDEVTTTKFNLSYQATPDLLVYAQAAQGFRVGGYNTNPTNNPDVPEKYKSDSLWNYEIGGKAGLFDGALLLNAALFYVDWSDIQTRVFISGAGFNGNAGRAHSAGIELSAEARPTERWQLSFSGTLMDAKLDEDAPVNALFPTGVEGKKGDRLPGVPRVSLSAAAQYSFPLSDRLTGVLRSDVSYVGNSFTQFRAEPPASPDLQSELKAYALANLRATVQAEHWDATLYIDNVFDKRATLDVYSFLGQETLVTTNRPRTVGIRLLYKL